MQNYGSFEYFIIAVQEASFCLFQSMLNSCGNGCDRSRLLQSFRVDLIEQFENHIERKTLFPILRLLSCEQSIFKKQQDKRVKIKTKQ